MKLLACLLLLAVACAGCSRDAATQPNATQQITVSLAEAKRIQRIRDLKKPAHVQKVDELLAKCESEESREGAWSRNLIILGAGLGVLAGVGLALKLLGVL